ncbi:MAG: hypothetical protein IPK16_01700 [Anaerolineales bacterium]|nr:hypothetical protein [Anaerolineales bacterium]
MHELPVVLLGLGSVGRALVRQIVGNRALHASEYGLILRLLAVTDRDGAVVSFDGRGISDAQLLDLIAYKEGRGRLADLPAGGRQDDLAAVIDVAGQPGAVVVDCTATEETAPALLYALHKKYKVVLANKKPLTIDQEGI